MNNLGENTSKIHHKGLICLIRKEINYWGKKKNFKKKTRKIVHTKKILKWPRIFPKMFKLTEEWKSK